MLISTTPDRVYYTLDKKHLGWYKPEQKVFRKVVDKTRHLLKIMDAWGIDKDLINDLEKRGCLTIRIKDTSDNSIYAISFKEFKAHAVERDFGDRMQLFVSRKFFNHVKV